LIDLSAKQKFDQEINKASIVIVILRCAVKNVTQYRVICLYSFA